jgi:hypothetical protein
MRDEERWALSLEINLATRVAVFVTLVGVCFVFATGQVFALSLVIMGTALFAVAQFAAARRLE